MKSFLSRFAALTQSDRPRLAGLRCRAANDPLSPDREESKPQGSAAARPYRGWLRGPGCALALLAAAFALCSGCKHPETGAYTPQSTTKFDTENREKFVLMDKAAQYSITCMGLQETPLPDGRLQVVARVRNRENRRLEVQINCEFKDAQGFALDSTPFQALILTENSTEAVKFESLNDKAKNYTIRVRQAR